MGKLLFDIVEMMAEVHSYIMTLNDDWQFALSDKQLHFVVIGLLGMILIFFTYPIFRGLARRKMYMTLSWIYVFTLIIVITFAIEIGQKVTKTGAMEFADIVYGISGFLTFFIGFEIIIYIIKGIILLYKTIKKHINKRRKK